MIILNPKHAETIKGGYKFKLNKRIQLNGTIRLEQFVFQNSQYTFSEEKMTNKFFIDNTEYEILGKFDTVDAFVKLFNTLNPNIKMEYFPHLFEMRIQSLKGVPFELNDNGRFLSLLGGIGNNDK